jgi:transcriptional regulator with XRE-family HTH domain
MNEARPKLGDCLRGVRRRLGLTLAQVAAQTGLSVSTLSKVENDQASLTYDKLLVLAEGLGVDIVELFSANPQADVMGRLFFNPPEQASTIQTGNYDYHYLCTELAGKKMVPITAELKSRTLEEFGGLVRHSGEEFTFVISGVVEFHSEYYKPITMRPGSSIYFDASMAHAYLSIGEEAARILCVCSAPENELTSLALDSTITHEKQR